jgi:hypothetical protein
MAEARLKDRYTLDRLPLAHSGMADVWPARDTHLDRQVIVKFLSSSHVNTDMLKRFRREALLTARLDHPGVPGIYDIGEHQSRPYLVLQMIKGITLASLVEEEGPLPVPWVACIGAQICSVLIAAQDIGLVHRDLKPSNVMLERSGSIKVLDFGVAAIVGDDYYSRITRSGDIIGTFGYMAPEQVLGDPADHRSDLYGLGGTMFYLLTGEPPFDGATTLATVRQQFDHQPPRPAQERADTPVELDDLIYALLAKQADQRPVDAAEVYDLLAPMSGDLPPLPGVVNEDLDAARCYAVMVGQRPSAPAATGPRRAIRRLVDSTLTADEAERLYAEGKYRAAARCWRALADQHEERHGADHPAVIDWRLKAARAHVPLGEVDRAVRQLKSLLRQRVRVDGADHPAALELRAEIGRLTDTHPTAG